MKHLYTVKGLRIFLCIFIGLVFLASKPKRDKVTIKSPLFTIIYSEVLEGPISVEYTVNCAETKTKFSREGMDFYECDSVYTSDHNDYANNEWDKGHMAPAADFACDKNSLWSTFSYLNCSPQHKKLNRGVWRFLEQHERNLARQTKTRVKITAHYSKNSIKLPAGATVPDGYTKEITYGQIVEKYYFPNKTPELKSFTEYKILK